MISRIREHVSHRRWMLSLPFTVGSPTMIFNSFTSSPASRQVWRLLWTRLFRLQMKIRSQCGQPGIIDGAADGEVIEALKGIGLNAEKVVKHVVEVAAHAGGTNALCLRFQVKHLTKHPGLPEKSPVPPRAPVTDRVAKLGEHAEAKSAVRGDLLVAARYSGNILEVRFGQAPEPQVLGAVWRPFPQEQVS